MNQPIYVVSWPRFNGLEDRVILLEAAFPRASCIWINDFADFHFAECGAVVFINGSAGNLPSLLQLNEQIEHFKWALIVSIGDEGSGLHLELIHHPRASIWVQESKPGFYDTPSVLGHGGGLGSHDPFHRMPVGPIRPCAEFLPHLQKEMEEKPFDWVFSGSVRDVEWDAAIRALPGDKSKYYPYHLSTHDYIQHLASAKIVPCRPSQTTPETCRVYDALEAGCIPIVGLSPCGEGWYAKAPFKWPLYWKSVLGEEPPFPVIAGPEQLAGAVKETLDNWEERSKLVSSWWTNYKIRLAAELRQEVLDLRRASC